MTNWFEPETFKVPVAGGELHVARWNGSGPVVLAIHGITASHMEWPYLARALGDDVTLVGPDLRGRGGSRELPEPYGIRVHADDMVAVLDELEVEKAAVVGHSMGGFVAMLMALHYPERVESLVLVDGGFPLMVPPPDADVEQILNAMLGPAMERTKMTFESIDKYYDFWRAHPSFQGEGIWNEFVEAYIAYDLMGEPPELRSKVNIDAVLDDGRDSLSDKDLLVAPEKVSCPMLLLRAPRGLLNEDTGLYPDEVVADLKSRMPNLEEEKIEDVNHYTILLSVGGAKEVADRIRQRVSLP